MPPLSTTRVIHERWSEHHQPTAEGGMTATCRVERPAIGTHWDPETESTVPNAPALVVPSGPCRVQAFMRAMAGPQAGQVVTQRRYRVSLPADTPPADVNCRVVIESSSDPALTGATLFLEDVVMGSERFQRDYICAANEG